MTAERRLSKDVWHENAYAPIAVPKPAVKYGPNAIQRFNREAALTLKRVVKWSMTPNPRILRLIPLLDNAEFRTGGHPAFFLVPVLGQLSLVFNVFMFCLVTPFVAVDHLHSKWKATTLPAKLKRLVFGPED